jgi:hypothetical protein
MLVVSWRVCPWQTFPAYSNAHHYGASVNYEEDSVVNMALEFIQDL